MSTAARILIIEPSAALAQGFALALKRDNHILDLVDCVAAGRQKLARDSAQLILMDLDAGGVDMVPLLKTAARGAPVIVLTGQGSVQLAVDAMRAGAADVLLLPAGADRLRGAVTAALARTGTQPDAAPQPPQPARPSADTHPPAADSGGPAFAGFIGESPPMRAAYKLIEAAAPSKATVFVTGESGTGKEVCAEAIHQKSPRSGGPFIAINCAAIPKDLMESEIFGHVRGAFTGAATEHAGAALQADGGTLFLDEICEMDLALQAKLLRFLQTGMVRKVGSEKLEPVDVRIVCATNRDPYAEVQAGRFREDLFYRLQVISIELPPLRERGDDVLLIARHMLARFSREEGKSFRGFSPEAERILRDYAWPGNVRQLLNVVRNVVVLNDGEEIRPFMLPPPLNRPAMLVPPLLNDPRFAAMAGPLLAGMRGGVLPAAPAPAPILPGTALPPIPDMPPALPQAPPVAQTTPDSARSSPDDSAPALARDDGERRIRPLWMIEEEAIEDAIRICQGNITRAAALLEINPCTIYRRRQKKRAPAGH